MSPPLLSLGIENARKQTFAIHRPVGNFATEVHHHSRHQLLYAEGGVLHFFTQDKQFILPARHGAWIPANLVHRVESPSPQLHLRTLYFWRGDGEHKLPEKLTVFPVTSLAREMIVYTQRWPHENPVLESEDAFYQAILYLISDWCRDAISLVLPATQHQLLRNITGYLTDNIDSNLTLARVSSEFGVSSRTMMRLFRGHLDMTFQEYLRTARVIAALELLSSPDTTITEIALHVGYQSISSFSRTFKAYVGKSPSVFRNEMRSAEEVGGMIGQS
jgi:AraC-like DNA-binding protein